MSGLQVLALWLGVIVAGVGGVMLYGAGGLYIGLLLIAVAATGAVTLLVLRATLKS